MTRSQERPPARSPSHSGLLRALGTGALLAGPIAFFAVFFAAPVGAIIARGLTEQGHVAFDAIAELVTDEGLRGVAWFTLWQAALSTLLTVVAALPMAYVLGRLRFPGKSLLRALIVVPFVLPTVVVGTAFLAFLGPDGPLATAARWVGNDTFDLRRTVPAVLLAHVFFNYAVVARTVGSAWARLDPSTEEAARTLGASPWQTFREVTFPAIRSTVLGASAIVFLFSFTSFGVVKVLGGPRIATIEVEIHRLTTQLLDLRGAAALSLLQMATVVGLLFLAGRSPLGTEKTFGSVGRDVERSPSGGQRWVLTGTLGSAGLLLIAPIVVLVEASLSTSDGYGLRYYRTLSETARGSTAFVPPIDAITNSLKFGVAAAVIALVVGLLASLAIVRMGGRGGRLADTALTLPLGTSAVTIGFGFIIALDQPPLDLRTSPLLIPAAQALIAVPFVIRSVLPALRNIDPRLREAASTLGASPARTTWEIDVRLLAAPLLVASGFAFAISLGEFGATIFIARANAPTVPVAIFRALSRPGALSLGQAMAMSTILMVLTAAVMLLVDRFRDADAVGGFV